MATGVFGGRCVDTHSAQIFDRGGTKRIGPLLDLSRVQWERARDDISEASIRLEAAACAAQEDFLARIRSHRHELVLFRGQERVWEGPIHRVGLHGSYAEIAAKDVLEYVNKTPLTQKWDNSYAGGIDRTTEVTTRIGDIIVYELTHGRIQKNAAGVDVAIPAWESLSPPANVRPYLVIHHAPNEARTSALTLPYEMSVAEHLDGLARTAGIDYTVVGRAIHVWDVSRNLGVLTQMTEANFANEVVVTEYGADHAQASYVVSQNGVYGSAVNEENLDYYGPWTTIFTSYNEEGSREPTQSELDSQASRNLSGRSPAPIEVRIPDNSGIVLTDVLRINHLVPGVQVPLRATLNARKIVQTQKIDHVKVVETPDNEDVQVTLTPATKPDSDDPEED